MFSDLSMTVEYHLSITDHISWDSGLFQLPLKHKVLPQFQKGLKKDHNSYILHDQGTKIFQYCTCPAGHVTYNFHLSCKHMHLSFKSVCNKEHKGVICNRTSSSNSSRSTRPTGRVLSEELLLLSRFHL